MYVKEAMTSDVRTCGPHSSLDDVARMMWDADCGAIPVVTDDNKPMGIITDRDIAIAAMLNHQPLWDIQASTVIQGQTLCCCEQQESIESCLRKMQQAEVRRIVVTDESGSLVGILSMGDAVAFTKGESINPLKREKVDVDNVLGMLKQVSGHHTQTAQGGDGQSSMRSEQRQDGKSSSSSSLRNEQRPESQPGFRR